MEIGRLTDTGSLMKINKIIKITAPIALAAAIVLIWNWQTLLWVVGGVVVLLGLAFLLIDEATKSFGRPKIKKKKHEK